MKRMLITGATGSLGSELVAKYYRHYEISIHGRDAQRLLKLKMQYPGCTVVLGDLRCHALRGVVCQNLQNVLDGVRRLFALVLMVLGAGMRNLAENLFGAGDGARDLVEILVVLHLHRFGIHEAAAARARLVSNRKAARSFDPGLLLLAFVGYGVFRGAGSM